MLHVTRCVHLILQLNASKESVYSIISLFIIKKKRDCRRELHKVLKKIFPRAQYNRKIKRLEMLERKMAKYERRHKKIVMHTASPNLLFKKWLANLKPQSTLGVVPVGAPKQHYSLTTAKYNALSDEYIEENEVEYIFYLRKYYSRPDSYCSSTSTELTENSATTCCLCISIQ